MQSTLSRRSAAALLLVSLLVLLAVPTLMGAASRDRANLGARPPAAAPTGFPEGANAASTPARTGPAKASATKAPKALPLPVRIRHERLGIDAAVRPTGVNEDGTMELPEEGSQVGWYRFGVRPGAPAGSAVLAGHVDTVEDGPGALYPLRDARPGDRMTVVREKGRPLVYEVVARERFPRDALPAEELFAKSGPARLTVITCGGTYERGRGYSDNIVVTAVPVSGTSGPQTGDAHAAQDANPR